MKKSQKCIKCKSENIIGLTGKGTWFDNGAYGNYLHVAAGMLVEKETYVCCDCGYSEEWVNEDDLEILKSSIGTKRDISKNKSDLI